MLVLVILVSVSINDTPYSVCGLVLPGAGLAGLQLRLLSGLRRAARPLHSAAALRVQGRSGAAASSAQCGPGGAGAAALSPGPGPGGRLRGWSCLYVQQPPFNLRPTLSFTALF